MIFKIDSDKVISKGIDFNTFFILMSLYNKESLTNFYNLNIKLETKFLDKAIELNYMINKGIKGDKYRFENLSITPLFFDDFIAEVIPIKIGVESWIDQWYDLWPTGVKSGNFYVKTSKSGCLKKMIDFVDKYPQYTKGIIIGATKKYLDIMSTKNYSFCKLAPYFIIKDGVSMLEGYCQQLHDNIGKVEIKEGFTDDI